ncbi:MAG: adenylosuccinate lyase [Planctomycetes bacterium]|jgi:adenylosuccinate lyase|nr:adenylosuccinate lyase [Planctomycetota bacterium]MBT4029492.1 adenylosuccinate lyase [Planctomycetota bacterium]MBT4560638.1 adenylosuccinate lyase [Planctomycetota bacterium]MBT5120125.1 adenylosuccinate lyase [Planctomycetota bacterium]MBT7011864.1 adenylosuccinate lyase [Planctomycetota bacterium]
MTDPHATYSSPLASRYASPEMQSIFSYRARTLVWRDLWIHLAECERELGLDISEAQIAELKTARNDIDFDRVAELERELRHDVMAHVHAFGEKAPSAKGILHLGATSCFVADGADLVSMQRGLEVLRARLVGVIRAFAGFCHEQRAQAALGFTHFQSAQPTTMGKRATLWLQDFLLDLEEVEDALARLPFRGVKGTTGTQASFLQLFDGDHSKVRQLDKMLTERMGFARMVSVCGQTYPRKWDGVVLAAVSGIGASAAKFAGDVRLLAHRRELEEPFGKKQIGSSAMPYKRNPMRSERVGALSRYLLNLAPNALDTAANQWLERTLDDSANRRIAIPESFLAADAILQLVQDVASGLVVYPKVLEGNLNHELPFMATETILMAAVQKGGDRQDLHERIRVHSHEAAYRLKAGDGRNDLLERITADEAFAAIVDDLPTLLDPMKFVGRAPQQVDEFLEEVVRPILDARADVAVPAGEIKV